MWLGTRQQLAKLDLAAMAVRFPHIAFSLTVRDLGLTPQSALEFFPIHCPKWRLGQDLGFGGFAFALKLPELQNRNLAAVRAKLGQTSCFPNGAQTWCQIGQ